MGQLLLCCIKGTQSSDTEFGVTFSYNANKPSSTTQQTDQYQYLAPIQYYIPQQQQRVSTPRSTKSANLFIVYDTEDDYDEDRVSNTNSHQQQQQHSRYRKKKKEYSSRQRQNQFHYIPSSPSSTHHNRVGDESPLLRYLFDN